MASEPRCRRSGSGVGGTIPRKGRLTGHFTCRPPLAGGFGLGQPRCPNFPLVISIRERVVSPPQGGAPPLPHRTRYAYAHPFADDGGSHAWRARLASPSAPRFAIWRFLLAVAALPPLLAFMAAASWLAWMCFRGVIGPPGAVIALAGITALAALIRRHTGMEVGLALCLIAVVGLVAVVWVVFALLAVALVAGG